MSTVASSIPRRHGSSFLHRNHSSPIPTIDSNTLGERVESNKPSIFQGTDTIAKNRKLALQRVVEAHNALELMHIQESQVVQGSRNRTLSNERFDFDFDVLDLPSGEIRAFRYFLRRWNSSENPDSEFDNAIESHRPHFEAAAIKHFFRRIALWDESEELLLAAKKEMTKKLKRGKKEEKESELSRLWLQERERQGHGMRDELKEVTTREGLAQLLWTLMHDATMPLAPDLFNECLAALKQKYGMTR
jgi:hypothetical protein